MVYLVEREGPRPEEEVATEGTAGHAAVTLRAPVAMAVRAELVEKRLVAEEAMEETVVMDGMMAKTIIR